MQAKEPASDDTIVGDPTISGATLTVLVLGITSASQAFVLPAGTDPASGKPFWNAINGGFKYKDGKGVNGPVTVAQLKKSGSGTVSIKVVVLAKRGTIDLLPPNPGSSACARLDGGGDSYHVGFPPPPDATVKKNDAKSFLVKDAPVEQLCTLPTCGNGIKEPGEACDGGPFCAANCFASITSCCFVPGQCATLPSFTLLTTFQGICRTNFEPFGSGQVIGGASARPMARA